MKTRKIGSLGWCLFLVASASAAWLDETRIAAAAAAFPVKDAAGRTVLPGRTVTAVEAWDVLWIVRYAPSGHAVFSGSDRVGPVIAFGAADYVAPREDEPFYRVLAGAAAGCRKAEEEDETASGAARRAKWTKLLTTLSRVTTAGTSAGVTVTPFLTTKWNQCQPYNDFAPVHDDTETDAYRGRTPCGCVATAAAQILAYWQWPARVDAAWTFSHEFADTGGTYDIRFDGHVPFDWDALADRYTRFSNGYDLRGHVAESVRYPVARLIQFCGSLSAMAYGSGASGADYEVLIGNAPWYTGATRHTLGADLDPAYTNAVAAARADLVAGRPVMVAIPGHAVVGHGWLEEDDGCYIYLNYGWSGSNDNYYNLDDRSSDSRVEALYTGFQPKAMAQLDPLPAVSGTDVALRWHVPPRRAEHVTGCTVAVRTADLTAMGDFTDDFSSCKGVLDGRRMSVASGKLNVKPLAVGTYTWPEERLLTARSVLTFQVYSAYALGLGVNVEARLDGGAWTVLSTPDLNTETWGGYLPKTVRVFLGGSGGKTARFRVRVARTGNLYYPEGTGVTLDEFNVTETYGLTETRFVQAPDATAAVVTGCTPGKTYVFSVALQTAAGTCESDSMMTKIEGEGTRPVAGAETAAGLPAAGFETVRFERLEPPRILSVVPSKTTLAEKKYAECSMGGNVFSVACSPGTVSLEAHVSAASLIPDSALTVHALGSGLFALEVDASGIPDYAERTRAVLTLAARNANGTAAYRDFSVRFSSETEADAYVAVEAVTQVDGAVAVRVPYAWFCAHGLAVAGAADAVYRAAAEADTDGDGVANWKEYVCGTDPTRPEEMFLAFLTMTDGEATVTHNLDEAALAAKGFSVAVQGKTVLTDTWSVKTSGHRFFRVVLEPSLLNDN